MGKYPIPIAQVLAMLQEQPQVIAVITAGLTPAQLKQRPTAEHWSCVEILGHLRTSADGWGRNIDTILAIGQPARQINGARADFFKIDRQYLELGFAPSLSAYQQQRKMLLSRLAALPAEAWDYTATSMDAKATPARTVYFYAQKLARHERTHVAHFRQTVRRLKR